MAGNLRGAGRIMWAEDSLLAQTTETVRGGVAAGGEAPVRAKLVLGICCLSLLLVGMDVTIVNVALPAMQRDLHASLSGLQWIVDAYTLVVASLLMLSGSMSDRFGRRRVFQIGLTLFSVGSLLCSLAHTMGQLVFYRALQGLGASMLNPVALSIIATVFPNPKDRARAVGIWGAVAGVSLAVGPLLGGALTQSVGWRSIFWINVPIGVTAIALAAKFVPESKAVRARAFDPVGQGLVFAGLTTLTYAVIEGPRAGWGSGLILGLFAVAALALVGFVLYEPRRRDPLVDLRFFHSVPFSSATVLALCAFASFAGFLFLNVLYLQQERGFSALHTGLCTLPLAVMMMVCAPLSGRLVGSYGARAVAAACGRGVSGKHAAADAVELGDAAGGAAGGVCAVWGGSGDGEPGDYEQCRGGNAVIASGGGGGDCLNRSAGWRGAGGRGGGDGGEYEPADWC